MSIKLGSQYYDKPMQCTFDGCNAQMQGQTHSIPEIDTILISFCVADIMIDTSAIFIANNFHTNPLNTINIEVMQPLVSIIIVN